jgi:hypothetical protein
MKANYGKKLREFFSKRTTTIAVIDFGSYKVFDAATVNNNILIGENKSNQNKTKACAIGKDFIKDSNITIYFEEKHLVLECLTEDSWIIGSSQEYAIKMKIEKIGTPLKDWHVSINYGVKTGYNNAFIINREKKDELIGKDSKNAKIIKPVLRGCDINRYKIDYADMWMIGTFPSLNIDIDQFPILRDYFRSFGKRLHQTGETFVNEEGISQKTRKKTGNKWFETQDQIAYYQEFEKEKIVWGNLALCAQYSLAKSGFLINAPCTMITPGNKYLLAVLNSKLGDFYIRTLGVTRNGGYFEYKPMFVERLPVSQIPKESQIPFEILVDYILYARENDLILHCSFFEELIDGMVFELYFPDEIKAANKEILRHIGDLKPITDPMADDEKLAIIQKEFDRLYDPDHNVRTNLETLDSVEEVRIVFEALK